MTIFNLLSSRLYLHISLLLMYFALVFAAGDNTGGLQPASAAILAGTFLLGSSILILPTFTIVSGDRLHRDQADRDAAYLHLIDILLNENEYEPQVNCYGDQNPHILDYLRSLTFNAYYVGQSLADRLRIDADRRFAFDLMLGWIARLFNEHAWVFPIILLSLWAYRSGVPKPFWQVLRRVRLLYDIIVIETLAKDVGHQYGDWVNFPDRFPNNCSRDMVLVACDNLQLNFTTNFEGCREHGDGNYFYIFVTWLICALPLSTIQIPFDREGIIDNEVHMSSNFINI